MKPGPELTTSQLGMAAYRLYVQGGISQDEASARVGGDRNQLRRVVQIVRQGGNEKLLADIESGKVTLQEALRLSLKRGPASSHRLTPAQIRTAMQRFMGFDAVSGEFAPELLQQVPAEELDDFDRRLRASRRATEQVINEIRKIKDERSS